MKILITGIAGNIGSILCEYLLNIYKNIEIIGVDNLSTGKIKNIQRFQNDKRLKLYFINCNHYPDIESVFIENEIDYVFHYAACVGVERTLSYPDKVFEDLDGIKFISKLSRNFNVKKIAFSSSSEVYGEPRDLPLIAGVSPSNPSLPYAVVKTLGEIYFDTFHKDSPTRYINFRFFNTYGPNQSLDYVIPKFIFQAQRGQDIEIFGDGAQTRTFLYVQDNVEATVRMMFDDKYFSLTQNIGSENMIEIEELAKLIKDVVGSKSRIVFKPGRQKGDAKTRQPENTEFLNVLGRKPTDLRDGIFILVSKGVE